MMPPVSKVEPRKHPSGRPKAREEYRRLSVYRVPSDGPVTPRLQRKVTDAIGFRRFACADDDEE